MRGKARGLSVYRAGAQGATWEKLQSQLKRTVGAAVAALGGPSERESKARMPASGVEGRVAEAVVASGKQTSDVAESAAGG